MGLHTKRVPVGLLTKRVPVGMSPCTAFQSLLMSGNKLPQQQQITSSREFAALVMTQVRQALDEILIATYTLEFDGFGQPLLSELEYCCQRGLRVRCLLDAQGSQHFIRDHPELFTKLETEIRIQHGQDRQNNRIVFDRKLALAGSHLLCETSQETKESSELISGASAAAIADSLDLAWKQSSSYANG
jgi:phosphatidylserine/phosphatidylglycerophosphate/cardiolipin synthase-like enzyme